MVKSWLFLMVLILVGVGCEQVSPKNTAETDLVPSEIKTQSVNKDELSKGLNSSSESERSQTAIDLHRQGDPSAVQALIQTIDDDADMLHLDYSPSVHALIEIGPPALPALVELLNRPDELTRLRAQRAIEGISLKHIPDEAEWRTWWKGIGYDYEEETTWADGQERLLTWASSLSTP